MFYKRYYIFISARHDDDFMVIRDYFILMIISLIYGEDGAAMATHFSHDMTRFAFHPRPSRHYRLREHILPSAARPAYICPAPCELCL